MALSSAAGDGGLLALSFPNLRKLDSSTGRVDKNRFLRAYIRSQDVHRTSHVIQGKLAVASWDTTTEDLDVAAKKPARDLELESGFGTPLLKPRAHTKESREQLQNESCVHQQNQIASSTKDDGVKAAKENLSPPRKRNQDRDGKGEREHKRMKTADVTRSATLSRALQSRGAYSSKPKEKIVPQRHASPEEEIDDEHCHRLAERRERRRAKKAIVDPKSAPQKSESDCDSNDEQLQRAVRKKGAKKKNGKKGLSIPAGLALMHGFSATNIGKNRLTLDPAVGVFNKGKASTKTSVSKTKTKPKPHLFSEQRFLSGTKNKLKTAMSNNRGDGDTEDLSDTRSGSIYAYKRKLDRPDQTKNTTSKRKRSRSPSTNRSSRSEQNCDEASMSSSPPAKKRRSARDESLVWDIEEEDGCLPAGSCTEHSAPGKPDAQPIAAASVLLDTRAFNSRWTTPKEKEVQVERSEDRVGEPVSAGPQQSDCSSISPSHSASQLAQRVCGEATQKLMFSRYFPISAVAHPEHSVINNNVSAALALPSREADNHPTLVEHAVEHENPVHELQHDDQASSDVPAAPIVSAASVTCHHRQEQRFLQQELSFPSAELSTDRTFPALRPNSPSSSLELPPGPESPASSGTVVFSIAPSLHEDTSHHEISIHPIQASSLAAVDNPRLDVPDAMDYDETPFDWNAETLGPSFDEGVPMFLSHMPDFTASAGHYADDITGLDEVEQEFADPRCHGIDVAPYVDDDALYWYEPSEAPVYDPRVDQEPSNIPYSCGVLEDLEPAGVRPYAVAAVDDDLNERRWEQGDYPEDDDIVQELGCDDTAFSEGYHNEEMEGEEVESDDVRDPSVLGSLQQFSQGRALLMGVTETEVGHRFRVRDGMSRVEEDVVRSLSGHWLPQRF